MHVVKINFVLVTSNFINVIKNLACKLYIVPFMLNFVPSRCLNNSDTTIFELKFR